MKEFEGCRACSRSSIREEGRRGRKACTGAGREVHAVAKPLCATAAIPNETKKRGPGRIEKRRMRQVGMVAAAIAAATALSSKQGRELLESKLQPLFLSQQEGATASSEEEVVIHPRHHSRRR